MSVVSSEPHIISTPNEYPLVSPPTDGISNVQFSPDVQSKVLLVSSWDCLVRIYQVGLFEAKQSAQRLSYSHNAPVLGCTFLDAGRCASGGLDHGVKLFDIASNTETVLGAHDKAVRCLEYNDGTGLLVTGSWDATVKLWDSRIHCCTSTHPQPERVYALTVSGNRIVVGTAERKVFIWDIRNMAVPEQRRESSLKFQTRAIRAFPNRNGFVISSIEGRVAVEYLDQSAEAQKKKYAFKCHRNKEDGQELIYPVNAIAFHPTYNSFATGGSDSLVNIWDPFNKKRLCQFHKFPTSVSSLAFNSDGSLLAIASSYQYEFADDPSPLPENSIFIRKVTDQEVKPKY